MHLPDTMLLLIDRATSFVGTLVCVVPFSIGVYYTFSLRELNVLYVLTSRRVIFCKKKGFTRSRLRMEEFGYEMIPGILHRNLHFESVDNRNDADEMNAAFGDIFFLKDLDVHRRAYRAEWKTPTSKMSTPFVGFRNILDVRQVEQILVHLVNIEKRQYNRQPAT